MVRKWLEIAKAQVVRCGGGLKRECQRCGGARTRECAEHFPKTTWRSLNFFT